MKFFSLLTESNSSVQKVTEQTDTLPQPRSQAITVLPTPSLVTLLSLRGPSEDPTGPGIRATQFSWGSREAQGHTPGLEEAPEVQAGSPPLLNPNIRQKVLRQAHKLCLG